MEFWITLWKCTLVIGLSVFAVMAVIVTIFGARDIKKLFQTLGEEHDGEVNSDQ